MSSGRPQTLRRSGAPNIAYRATPGKPPGVLFCGGYGSDMTGAKAAALEQHCRSVGRACVRFDYTGHGESDGVFEDCTLTDWVRDSLDIFDAATEGPQVAVGSSMGGWIMLLLALRRPHRVAGLLGIAAAPDFTEDLLPTNRTDDPTRGDPGDAEAEIAMTPAFIESGRAHLVLRTEIPIGAPTRLLHGTDDDTVPWRTSLRLLERLAGDDVALTLVKGGGHRLSEPPDLALLVHTLEELFARVELG